MNKTSIEWTEYSWNPFKGKCPVKCKLPDGQIYCYGHKIYDRFSWMEEGTGDYGALAEYELEQPGKLKKPSKIFICSTFELFYHKSGEARDEIFKVIEDNPRHTFQVLTKMPENIDRPMPDNVHLGISVGDDREKSIKRTQDFLSYIIWKSNKKELHFLSMEPLIYSHVSLSSFENVFPYFGWVVVGRLTGHGKKHDPSRKNIQWIVDNLEQLKIPVFLKNNLKDIWGPNLIQEWPKC